VFTAAAVPECVVTEISGAGPPPRRARPLPALVRVLCSLPRLFIYLFIYLFMYLFRFVYSALFFGLSLREASWTLPRHFLDTP